MRDITSFGVSVGTGLALESLFISTEERIDNDRVAPVVSVEAYRKHYFNIYTLVRNYLTAHKLVKDKVTLLSKKNFITDMVEEIETIATLYEDITAEFYLYIPTNIKTLTTKYNNNKLKTVTKSLQEYSYIEPYVKKIVNELPGIKKVKTITNNKVDILVFTHYLLDFLKLDKNAYLFESHTGKVKSRIELNSKYHSIGKRDLSHLPFVDILLLLLGDKTLITPTGLAPRIALYNLSKECKWTTSTTKEKIIYDFDKSDIIKKELLKYKL